MTDCKTNWSYLAAMFDAEGCFTIAYGYTIRKDKNSQRAFYSHEGMTIGNTSLTLMKWLVQTFGGVSYETPTKPEYKRRQVFYSWRIKGRQNKIAILLGVLPYLIIKREQANVLLQYLRLPNTHNVVLRTQLAERIQELNQRGKTPTTNTPNSPSEEMKIESELHSNMQSDPTVTLDS